ncbi:uncharacterized protein SPSK_00178 [Sporothrix schenckii 1099-18]|uniref:Uncharacterized protein n=1 Tax=Sporothrix schenckii 1099-18 TaxID=1397361 RepID=A0A0F2M206_SPOSC|nr:uncharacterized protein SPSK_00178 [Sporothrix schenckii 1099-18]KJR83737.1 hypothetical protein SPSK_00178 [Sporothrix schenckii 1099-18]
MFSLSEESKWLPAPGSLPWLYPQRAPASHNPPPVSPLVKFTWRRRYGQRRQGKLLDMSRDPVRAGNGPRVLVNGMRARHST